MPIRRRPAAHESAGRPGDVTRHRSLLSLTLACAVLALPGQAQAQGPLTNGGNHTGAIAAPGETDSWTFSADKDDTVALSVAEIGPDSPFVPWIRVERPDGTEIASSWGPLVGQADFTAPLTGVYTVRIASADSGRDDTGDYQLTLIRSPGGLVVPPGDEGGPITNGLNYAGHVHTGDLDAWTFTASLGDAISVSVGETNIPEIDPG